MGICLAAALIALPLLAAAPAPRGHPASRLADTGTASEYWDLVALFDSNHKLFARFMITNEGPGENTGIAYGHFVEPDGTTWFFSNGRREGRWHLGPRGLLPRGRVERPRSDRPAVRAPRAQEEEGRRHRPALHPRRSRGCGTPRRSGEAPSVDLLATCGPHRGVGLVPGHAGAGRAVGSGRA